MASPPPPPPPPVGEDSWLDFIEQQRRNASGLEQRIHVVELFRSAVGAEPSSLRVWIAYCEYFWSLYVEGMQRTGAVARWPADEQAAAADIFTLDAALRLWSDGHEATKYRLSDSHELWNRWIALERELLDRTRTAEGVRRITHLYRNRLTIPHTTWDDTSSAFSSFLSEYNPAAYEDTMRAVTEQSRAARYIYEQRDPFEMALRKAVRAGDDPAHRDAMARYLDWEVANALSAGPSDKAVAVRVALGLFGRALTGIFQTSDAVWTDVVVFVAHLRSEIGDSAASSSSTNTNPRDDELARILPNSLDILQRAVQHCPWSGILWARYILCGEQAGLSFSDMERIKHAATNSPLDRDGMTAVVDMYAAWCGYLRRSAMDPNASDEAIDLADSGLVAALEAIQVWGERRFGSAFQGDPSFRLERIMIHHLTEKHGALEEARDHWEKLAKSDLLANDYSFWMSYYVWEMNLYQAQKGTGRSPTPASTARPLRAPTRPARILQRALQVPHLNWPERIMEVYVKHCNEFESADVLRIAFDDVHQLQKLLDQRRKEAATAAAVQSAQADAQAQAQARAQAQAQAQVHAQAQAPVQDGVPTSPTTESQAARAPGSSQEAQQESPSGTKRKWETSAGGGTDSLAKRPKTTDGVEASESTLLAPQNEQQQRQALKRDRENTSVYVANLPADVTSTKVRHYFRDYGHVNNIQLKPEEGGKSAVALVEFRSVEDVQSALIRDGKYFGDRTISVKAATGVTLYLTNFPPTADDAYIRDLFKDCGELFGIRWPSLKFNTHRRFCYVSFRHPESAAKALQLDGTVLEDRYKLSVQYSNPGMKKARAGAVDEGREVHVKNLELSVDEPAIEALFAKHGAVERVRLLRNMAGRSRGSAFVVFRDKADAERAIASLDNAKFGSHILTVELSVPGTYKPSARETSVAAESTTSDKPTNHEDGADGLADSARPDARHDGLRDRTFALLGLPDTVNIARVRALLEPYGHVVKLVLRPDHGGAIVEFADAVTAGKAQLALDGTDVDGHTFRIGTVAELFREKGEVRIDRIDKAARRPDSTTATPSAPKNGKAAPGPTQSSAAAAALLVPPRVKRPVLGGAKRGVAFAGMPGPKPAKTNGEPTSSNGVGAGANASPVADHAPPPSAKKSNAEFRTMFLGSGTDDTKDKTDGAAGAQINDASKMEVDVAQNGH
ncbi:pre-mRNA splicing factor [Niveomyces insectorum RCEF 264]|uniref:U4/U6 snRNA-associated-splicing factor PRP24 n=1 Tax=Niveomyces insectorum RCEF 264 TaxID=1081102 RepID=A0A167UUX5_9HYPO|nr:pre-mRNA splicing factor [Niveomyces insectorum RCEF 264]